MIGFLLVHSKTLPFESTQENNSQTYGMVSILLVLFSGILLRADASEDENDVYATTLISIVLVGSQAAVLLIFAYQVTHPSRRADGTKDVVKAKLVDAAAQMALDEFERHIQEVLDTIEEAVQGLAQDGKVSKPVVDLVLEVVTAVKEGGLEEEEREAISEQLVTLLQKGDPSEIVSALWDITLLIGGDRLLMALSDVVVERTTAYLEVRD